MALKAEILDLLKRDEEFRYAVAGLIGLQEILKRLDGHGEELVRLREDMNRLREDMNRLREDMNAGFRRHDEEIAKLREDMVAGFKRHDEEIAKLREDMNRLREDMIAGFKRHDEEIAKLREDMVAGFKRHDEEIAKLREDMNAGFKRHDEEMARMRRDIRDLKVTMERMVLSEEEEAREVLGHRLRALGISMALRRLELPGLEIDLYGTSDGICLIGEATVRAGRGLVEELDAKAELLARRHPELLRPRLMKAIYTIIATPDAIEEAERRGVWILDWKGDLSKGPRPA